MANKTIASLLQKKRLTLSVAESCTAGLIASDLTDIPGASRYFKGGIIAYANEVKEKILNVPKATLREFGAVSHQTALAMAHNVRHLFKAHIGLAVTGIAGPTGGTSAKPVGTVFIAVSLGRKEYFKKYRFSGSRLSIKIQSKDAALRLLKECLT